METGGLKKHHSSKKEYGTCCSGMEYCIVYGEEGSGRRESKAKGK